MTNPGKSRLTFDTGEIHQKLLSPHRFVGGVPGRQNRNSAGSVFATEFIHVVGGVHVHSKDMIEITQHVLPDEKTCRMVEERTSWFFLPPGRRRGPAMLSRSVSSV